MKHDYHYHQTFIPIPIRATYPHRCRVQAMNIIAVVIMVLIAAGIFWLMVRPLL